MLISTAYAEAATEAPIAASGATMDILFMLAFVVIIYFFLLRPQNKRFKAHQELVTGLKVGDKVITDSGIHGVVKSLEEHSIQLEVATDVTMTVVRNSVAANVAENEDENNETTDKKDSK